MIGAIIMFVLALVFLAWAALSVTGLIFKIFLWILFTMVLLAALFFFIVSSLADNPDGGWEG